MKKLALFGVLIAVLLLAVSADSWADEPAEYIEKISGAKPKVIEGKPDPLPETAIWFGYQPVLKTLFPKLDFDFQHPEEILIAASESHLVIAGRDRWNSDHLVVEGIDEKIVGKQQEYGTAGAVYTFLQEQLGVRWLWPGELGEDVPRRATISIAPVPTEYWSKPEEQVAKKVLANWEAIQKILDAHPYALNPGPIRPTTPRMAGLHPEYPARKWKPQPKSQRPQDLDLE